MINETGEWDRDVDWDYVKENPDDESEESLWMKLMWKELQEIEERTDSFEILDIKGFDTYQGPYAIVKIFNRKYEIWNLQEDIYWIDDFPINNMDEDQRPGFSGNPFEIISMIHDIENSGGFDVYFSSKKYNL